MVKYQFIKSENYFLIEYSGAITIEEVFMAIDSFGNDDSLPRDLKIFENTSNSTTTFSTVELKLIIARVQSHLFKFNTIRHAIVHANPNITALTMLVDLYLENEKIQVKNFSTESAALFWLNSFG